MTTFEKKTAGQIFYDGTNKFARGGLGWHDIDPALQEDYERGALAVAQHTIDTARAARPVQVTTYVGPEDTYLGLHSSDRIGRPRYVIFVPVVVEKLVCALCGAEAFPNVPSAELQRGLSNEQASASSHPVLEARGRCYPPGWHEAYPSNTSSMREDRHLCPDCAPTVKARYEQAFESLREMAAAKRSKT